ncbi:MAG TPA: hypothetical protein VD927_06540 [Chryseosolibacter sp.]|nr:hypothetical protein [Chryseosolibacter sp.]
MKKTLLALMAAFAIIGCSDLNIAPQENQKVSGEDYNITAQSDLASAVAYSYEAQSNGTVKFSFVNTTSETLNGDLIREGVSFLQNGTIITEFSVAPGEAYTYIDDNVQANETYRYIFEYFYENEWQFFFDEVAVVSDVPAIGNFTLIAAAYDDEYEVLTDGYTINMAGVNIRAEANDDKTGSIEFFLNGKKFHDNTAPFALYGDDHGDYKMGRLDIGSYTLTAIAYPEKNGKGIPGDTAVVVFNVSNEYPAQ